MDKVFYMWCTNYLEVCCEAYRMKNMFYRWRTNYLEVGDVRLSHVIASDDDQLPDPSEVGQTSLSTATIIT